MGGRSREYRRFAAECLAMARRNSHAQTRALLIEMAQRWVGLAELAERNSVNHRAMLDAIGRELRALHRRSRALPPHILALLAALNMRESNGDEEC
jgi:hypothetical protein